jgi:flagellar biosynthetic protein FlhB
MSDQGQKTEQPTERRLKKARDDGQFPVSREFVAAVQFTAFVAMVAGFGPQWWEQANFGLRGALKEAFRNLVIGGNLDRGALVPLALSMATSLLWPFALLGGVLLLISVAAQLGATKLGLASKRLAPDLTRLDPLKRLKQLPRQNAVQFVQAAVLLPLFLYAVYVVGRANLDAFLRLPSMGLPAGVRVVAGSLEDLLWKAAGLFLVVGFVDLIRQRRRWLAELKMSKQEIREEMKDIDGNPMTKMRIRRIQRDLMRRRMMQDVEKATAVVVNPTHFAVAIRYVPAEMPAPKVVAKGKNFLALRIRERAIRHQVPVVENPPLAQALYKSAEVGQEIPAHLYRAVAEVLAYIYRLMNGRLPGSL